MSALERRIPVALLGATGSVGQRFVERLAGHPWFELVAVAASPASAGRRYGDVVAWTAPGGPPSRVADLRVGRSDAPVDAPLVFSALRGDVAGPIEERLARSGRLVVTNASSHRLDADVPLIVPEVNPDHLALLERPGRSGGAIVANPNCTTIGLVLALAPLVRAFGVRRVHAVTLQAISGAGRPRPASLDLVDNVSTFIPGEEEKLAHEPAKILGELGEDGVRPATIAISAQCNRVLVRDGHTVCASVELARPAEREAIVEAWSSFRGLPQELRLPSAPRRPVVWLDDPTGPEPRRHRDLERGMAAVVGRLAPCPVLGWRFVALSHNTLRGAAGGAVLVAELLRARGWLDGE